jgi:hypothetical protein
MVFLWDMELNPKNLETSIMLFFYYFNHVPVLIHCKTVAMGKHIGVQLGKGG